MENNLNYRNEIIGALCILRTTLSTYDTELAHNILIGGGTDEDEERQEENLEEYINRLDELIQKSFELLPK